jgi:hypothetical protein
MQAAELTATAALENGKPLEASAYVCPADHRAASPSHVAFVWHCVEIFEFFERLRTDMNA